MHVPMTVLVCLHVERGKRRGGSVSRVVVGAPLGRAASAEKAGFDQGLNLALFIDAEHQGALGRREI